MNLARLTLGILTTMAFFNMYACRATPKIPAAGQFRGEVVQTTVDSELARYYLEAYLQGRNHNQAMHARIDSLYRNYEQSLPSREDLAAVSRDYSVDVASLYFADRLFGVSCNQALNQDFLHYLKEGAAESRDLSPYVLLFIPGWDYANNGHLTGADFKEPRRLATQFGFENHLVALPPAGSVEENAQYLAAEIATYRGSGKSIVLVGASSAGPAVHLALSELVSADDQVAIKAWINLGGILQGSPLIDYLQKWPQRWLLNAVAWFKGWDRSAIQSMGTAPSRRRYDRLQIRNPHLLIINYVGIPLSGQIGKFAGDKYPLLRPEGPNDGLTLVRDVIAPNSLTIVALGRDHFFAEDPRINEKTVALMKLTIAYLEKDKPLRCD